MLNSPTIQPGTVADARDIAALGARVFRETFTDVTQPADMQAFLADTYTPQRLASELGDPARVFFVARAGNALAGFAQMRRDSTEPSVRGPAPVELQRLYIDAGWHGRGVAQALIGEALTWAQEAGYQTLWLGVGDTNFRAQRFYSKLGLKVCGSHVFQVGSDAQVDLIMEGPISRQAALLP